MKKDLAHVEHNLIPLALIAANLCLAHFFYLFSIYQAVGCGEFIRIGLSMAIIIAGIIKKNKFLLISSVIFYFITLVIGLTC